LQINQQTSRISLILILVLTTLIYLPGLSGDFAFDDFPNLLQNKKLHLDVLSVDSLAAATFSSDSGTFKRPVSMFSFALNSYYFGMKPYSFKIVNLIIHLLTGLGIFFLSSLILKNYNQHCKQQFTAAALKFLPLFICCIWLVHPLNLTSVLYIIQRMTSLSGLFIIWASCAYVWTRARHYETNSRFWLILLSIILLGSLAILSKESGILLPLFLFLIEIFIFRFKNINGTYDKKIIALFTLIVILPAILSIVLLAMKPNLVLGGYDARDFTLTERLLTETRVLLFYLKMTIMPSINELGLYHDDFTISRNLLDPPSTLFASAFILSLIILALAIIKKQPLISFGIIWFFAAHLIESTIIPVEIAHEHRNYIAIFGIIFSLSYILSRLSINHKHPSIKYAIHLIPIILLASVTSLRSYQWSDNILHAVYEAKHHPDSARAIYSKGRIYANLAVAGNTDKTEDAFKILERSSTLYSRNILPDTAMILLSSKLKLPIEHKWIETIKNKLTLYPVIPTTVGSLMELTKCLNSACNINNADIDEIYKIALEKTSRRNPDIITIYAQHVAYNKSNLKKGEQLFNEAIALAPHKAQYRINLMGLLLLTKQYDKVRQQAAFLRQNNPLGTNNDLIQEIEMTLKNNTAPVTDLPVSRDEIQ